jgi:hypothetical protein
VFISLNEDEIFETIGNPSIYLTKLTPLVNNFLLLIRQIEFSIALRNQFFLGEKQIIFVAIAVPILD